MFAYTHLTTSQHPHSYKLVYIPVLVVLLSEWNPLPFIWSGAGASSFEYG